MKLPIEYTTSLVEVSHQATAIERETGVLREDIAWLWPRLLSCRDQVLADVENKKNRRPSPIFPEPVDSRFLDLPEELLTTSRSEVERMVEVARNFGQKNDSVVVLGIGGSYMGARALFEGCCHPHHNELPREQRRGHPRLYFEGNNLDNDTMAGLIELLENRPDEKWGIVVISKSGSTIETAVAFRIFVEALRRHCQKKELSLGEHILVVSQEGSNLWRLCQSLGVPEAHMFAFPNDVGGRFSVLSAVGLIPSAVVGLDVKRLLEGAVAANEAFRKNDPAENLILKYVAICHLMEMQRGASIRVLATWGKRLEALGLWYDQLLSESLGKNGQGATPLTVVNTRDLHSRGQQHQEGRRDKLFTNVWPTQERLPTLRIPRWDTDEDGLNEYAGRTVHELLNAARQGTNQAYAEALRRTAEIVIPQIDERTLGAVFQFLMLATVTEGYLIGINPYGQPGVEAYKRHMRQYLRKT
ncbi:MAG: glucose-6-phosphate isomerase [Thermogutta sp.]|jgi:glucose-6-phosphate isomerase